MHFSACFGKKLTFLRIRKTSYYFISAGGGGGGGGGGALKWNAPKKVKLLILLHVGADKTKPSCYACEFTPWKH